MPSSKRKKRDYDFFPPDYDAFARNRKKQTGLGATTSVVLMRGRIRITFSVNPQTGILEYRCLVRFVGGGETTLSGVFNKECLKSGKCKDLWTGEEVEGAFIVLHSPDNLLPLVIPVDEQEKRRIERVLMMSLIDSDDHNL